MLGTDSFEAHVSVPLVLEHEKVFRAQRAAMGLGAADCDRLLDLICRLSTHHEIYYLWRSQVRDPGDAHVLELAVASAAEAIITYNQRNFPDAASFGIDLLTSPEFLERIGAL